MNSNHSSPAVNCLASGFRLVLALLAVVVLSLPALAVDEQNDSAKKKTGKPTIEVERFVVDVDSGPGKFLQNLYVVYNNETSDAVIIDPGTRDDRVEAFIKSKKLKVRKILNTHGHGDHIGANGHYAKLYKVAICAHEADGPLYGDKDSANRPKAFFSKIESLAVEGFVIKVIHTPGHSRGSVCYLIQGHLFSGDTLFKQSIGRTWGDTPEAKQEKAKEEVSHIKSKLMVLPEETKVYPGHGESTTIGYEKKKNPFLK